MNPLSYEIASLHARLTTTFAPATVVELGFGQSVLKIRLLWKDADGSARELTSRIPWEAWNEETLQAVVDRVAEAVKQVEQL